MRESLWMRVVGGAAFSLLALLGVSCRCTGYDLHLYTAPTKAGANQPIAMSAIVVNQKEFELVEEFRRTRPPSDWFRRDGVEENVKFGDLRDKLAKDKRNEQFDFVPEQPEFHIRISRRGLDGGVRVVLVATPLVAVTGADLSYWAVAAPGKKECDLYFVVKPQGAIERVPEEKYRGLQERSLRGGN